MRTNDNIDFTIGNVLQNDFLFFGRFKTRQYFNSDW